MHEASLMRDLMGKLLAAAAAQGAERVVSIRVRLGALSHMSAEHFAEHFTHAAAGTIAEGARIDAVASTDLGAADAADVVLESLEIE